MGNIITYGTFDVLHYGHLELFRRSRELSDNGKFIVGLSTDDFNVLKGKNSVLTYPKRKQLLEMISIIDKIIPEHNWQQKVHDIKKYNVQYFVIGDDWKGKFDDLKAHCEVVYLPRTPDISSSFLKRILSSQP